MMPIPRITKLPTCFPHALVICAVLLYVPRLTFARAQQEPSTLGDLASPTRTEQEAAIRPQAPEAAQIPPAPPKDDSEAKQSKHTQLNSGREISWKHLFPNVLQDQKQIWWEFPKDLAHGKHWLPTAVVVAGTAGLIALDPHDEPYFRRTSTFDGWNRVMSFNATIAAMAAAPATTYVIGLVGHKSYAKQTAELTAEAVIDAGLPALVTRDIARRVPPSDIPGHADFSDSWFRSHRGPFYLGAGGFPSGHALAAFSIATIFADRYRHHRWCGGSRILVQEPSPFQGSQSRHTFLRMYLRGQFWGIRQLTLLFHARIRERLPCHGMDLGQPLGAKVSIIGQHPGSRNVCPPSVRKCQRNC